MQSEAWVWHDDGKLQLEAFELRDPGPGEALLAVRAAGICSTDLHVLQGAIKFVDPPHVMGHEGAGEVIKVGPNIAKAWLGLRCAVDTMIGCGHCRFCLSGRKHLCHSVEEIGVTIQGMWARHCIVPVDNLVPLPKSVSYGAATQMEHLHCVLGGVDKLHLRVGEAAIVLGCGVTSILFVRVLRLHGARRVVITGTRDNRLSMACKYGADEAINIRAIDLREALGDEQFEVVVETVGSRESIGSAGALAESGGRVLLFGIPPGHLAELDILDGIWRELSYIPSGAAPQVWPRASALLGSGLVDLEPLVSRRFSFETLDEAVRFAQCRHDECIKVVVETE